MGQECDEAAAEAAVAAGEAAAALWRHHGGDGAAAIRSVFAYVLAHGAAPLSAVDDDAACAALLPLLRDAREEAAAIRAAAGWFGGLLGPILYSSLLLALVAVIMFFATGRLGAAAASGGVPTATSPAGERRRDSALRVEVLDMRDAPAAAAAVAPYVRVTLPGGRKFKTAPAASPACQWNIAYTFHTLPPDGLSVGAVLVELLATAAAGQQPLGVARLRGDSLPTGDIWLPLSVPDSSRRCGDLRMRFQIESDDGPAAMPANDSLFASPAEARSSTTQAVTPVEVPDACGYIRMTKDADEREKKLYNAGLVSADTCYCHHFCKDTGKHCVLNGISSTLARRCRGVMFVDLGKVFGEKTCTCKPQRKSGGHDPCTLDTCPFLAEGTKCPFTSK